MALSCGHFEVAEIIVKQDNITLSLQTECGDTVARAAVMGENTCCVGLLANLDTFQQLGHRYQTISLQYLIISEMESTFVLKSRGDGQGTFSLGETKLFHPRPDIISFLVTQHKINIFEVEVVNNSDRYLLTHFRLPCNAFSIFMLVRNNIISSHHNNLLFYL